VYLSKPLRSSQYQDHRLDAIARHHGLGGKAHIGSLTTAGFESLLEYNVQDSRLASLIWRVAMWEKEIVNLACVSGAPVVDCIHASSAERLIRRAHLFTYDDYRTAIRTMMLGKRGAMRGDMMGKHVDGSEDGDYASVGARCL
jgi:hypothetical protein